MIKVFASVGKNPLTFDLHQIGEYIDARPEGVPLRFLLGQFKHSVRAAELAEVMSVLQQIKRVKIMSTAEGPVYYPMNGATPPDPARPHDDQ